MQPIKFLSLNLFWTTLMWNKEKNYINSLSTDLFLRTSSTHWVVTTHGHRFLVVQTFDPHPSPLSRLLRVNFSNNQNRRKLRKFWGIDLYAILKPSAKFKRNLFTTFEIISLLIFGCLTCILVGKHNLKKMLLEIQCIVIYQSSWEFTYKMMRYEIKLLRNFGKIGSIFFFAIKYKWHKHS